MSMFANQSICSLEFTSNSIDTKSLFLSRSLASHPSRSPSPLSSEVLRAPILPVPFRLLAYFAGLISCLSIRNISIAFGMRCLCVVLCSLRSRALAHCRQINCLTVSMWANGPRCHRPIRRIAWNILNARGGRTVNEMSEQCNRNA